MAGWNSETEGEGFEPRGASNGISIVTPSPDSGTSAATNYWTNFRGPERDGRYRQTAIRLQWPEEGLPLIWRQPVGGGYASFVVADGRAYTIEQRRRREVISAYDIDTGRELWTHEYDAEFRESMGGDGPRATPTWHDGRLYSMGAQGDLCCLDAKTGKLIWAKNILTDNGAQNLEWGMAASPLISDDKVIVLPGGPAGKSVVAYNRFTGARAWSSLSDQAAYSSPMLVTLAGLPQLLVVTASRVVGLGIKDGSLLWEVPWVTSFGLNIAQPVIVDGNRFIISAGYGHGVALIEVSQGIEGLSARKVWENLHMKNKFNSSVFHEGFLYGLDEGILACIDIETGARKWKAGRYGYGQLLLASGHLIIITEDGDLVLVGASPNKHQEVARFEAIEGKTWNNLAIANGRLLIRNQTQMACFDLLGR